jgi:UDP-N-acetylmuramate--alanine ligase
MITGIHDFKNVFFIGVAGVGMSAIAQYLAGIDKKVSGSDRYFKENLTIPKKNWEQQAYNVFYKTEMA